MLSYIGLLLIISGWAIQLTNKSNKITREFVIAYVLGVGLLVVDGLMNGLFALAFLNAVSLAVAAMLLAKIKKYNK